MSVKYQFLSTSSTFIVITVNDSDWTCILIWCRFCESIGAVSYELQLGGRLNRSWLEPKAPLMAPLRIAAINWLIQLHFTWTRDLHFQVSSGLIWLLTHPSFPFTKPSNESPITVQLHLKLLVTPYKMVTSCTTTQLPSIPRLFCEGDGFQMFLMTTR